LSCVAIVALLVTSQGARADDPSSALESLTRTDEKLQLALFGGGAVSVVAGATLCGFSRYDHALQVAGGVTLAFGAADLAAGIAGYLAARRDLRAMNRDPGTKIDPRDVLRVSEKKGVVFAVNLGLDGGFIFAGLTAVVASHLNVDHSSRWLGGGVATVAQGVFAAVVDLLGTLASRRAHRRMIGW
jgi:hypothetical protein